MTVARLPIRAMLPLWCVVVLWTDIVECADTVDGSAEDEFSALIKQTKARRKTTIIARLRAIVEE